MNIDFNEKELVFIEELARFSHMPTEKVIKQALRHYQWCSSHYRQGHQIEWWDLKTGEPVPHEAGGCGDCGG